MNAFDFEEKVNPDFQDSFDEKYIGSEIVKCHKRGRGDYKLTFKLRVVDEVERGVLSYHQAQKHYGIGGKSTVLVWLRRYGKLDWKLPKKNKEILKKEMDPQKRIKQLEAALKKEKDRMLVYETIFGVLQKDA